MLLSYPTALICGLGYMIYLTNFNAMRSAAAMADSNADIKTSMERLSTGSRINSASDEPISLAHSEHSGSSS